MAVRPSTKNNTYGIQNPYQRLFTLMNIADQTIQEIVNERYAHGQQQNEPTGKLLYWQSEVRDIASTMISEMRRELNKKYPK